MSGIWWWRPDWPLNGFACHLVHYVNVFFVPLELTQNALCGTSNVWPLVEWICNVSVFFSGLGSSFGHILIHCQKLWIGISTTDQIDLSESLDVKQIRPLMQPTNIVIYFDSEFSMFSEYLLEYEETYCMIIELGILIPHLCITFTLKNRDWN